MKHVSICEYNPEETIKTNYLGTKKIVKASIIQNVKNFLFISTDKAVCPSSLMGLSKKKAEKFVLNSNKHNKTKFSIIRFGNIIGSRGSVLEAFINQVKTNKRLSVTHNDMTRFFLTISLATKKIIQSINIMKGNEVFLINGMKSFKIYDLAKTIKKIFKYKKQILNIGLRAGEKLHEVITEKRELKNVSIDNNLIVINKNNTFKKNVKNPNKFDISSDKAQHLNCKEIEKYLIKDIKISKFMNY
jgi:FlaA1/EpsC-like NDP-sugar epimerase